MRVLIFETHADDAILSCSKYVGPDTHIVTLFDSSRLHIGAKTAVKNKLFFPYPHLLEKWASIIINKRGGHRKNLREAYLRKRESVSLLGFLMHYRSYKSNAKGQKPGNSKNPDMISRRLLAIIMSINPDLVLLPTGMVHPEHYLTGKYAEWKVYPALVEANRAFNLKIGVMFYCEIPYIHIASQMLKVFPEVDVEDSGYWQAAYNEFYRYLSEEDFLEIMGFNRIEGDLCEEVVDVEAKKNLLRTVYPSEARKLLDEENNPILCSRLGTEMYWRMPVGRVWSSEKMRAVEEKRRKRAKSPK